MEDRNERRKHAAPSVSFRYRGDKIDIKESLAHTLGITDLRSLTSSNHDESLVLIGRNPPRQQRNPRRILKKPTDNEQPASRHRSQRDIAIVIRQRNVENHLVGMSEGELDDGGLQPQRPSFSSRRGPAYHVCTYRNMRPTGADITHHIIHTTRLPFQDLPLRGFCHSPTSNSAQVWQS